MKILTIFTPTYNRITLLPRLYESLKSSNTNLFIWMIIDDGSTDGTGELVNKWKQEGFVEIQYFYKNNEGMHSAHNWAYERITTAWNMCIDSDDKLHPGAVEVILDNIFNLPDVDVKCLVGLDSDFFGKVLGKNFPLGFEKVKINQFMKEYKINGDKKFVFNTEVMKQVEPYPIFAGEKLVPLSYKYINAEENIYFKPVNYIFCEVEYQEDGSTRNMYRQYRKNPKGFNFSRIARINLEKSYKEKFTNAVHLVSGTLFTGDLSGLFRTRHPALVLAAIPAGILLNIYIRFKTKKNP